MKQKLRTLLLLSPLMMGSLSIGVATQPAAALDCAILPKSICAQAEESNDVKKTGTMVLLVWVLNILTAGVGIAAVGTLVYAGVLYSSAGGSSEQVAKAKKLITDVVIGIVVFALMYFALQWLLPGAIG